MLQIYKMNKKLHTLFFVTALFTLHTQAQTSQTPIAQWMMNGNAADSSGFGNHGTMYNLTPTAGRTGKPNTALFFNGQDSYINVPNSTKFDVPEFSLCATVKPTAFYNGKCQVNQIFYRGTSFSPGAYGMILYDNAYDGSDCNNFDSTKEVFAGGISTNGSASTEHYWQYTPTAKTNTWYSVVMTYDGSIARIYINGVQKSSLRCTCLSAQLQRASLSA